MKRQVFLAALAAIALAFSPPAFAAPPGGAARPAATTPPLKAPLAGWQVWPGSGARILPGTLPPTDATNAEVRLVSARGVVAAASFAVRAASALDGVAVKTQGLISASGASIPDAAADIRVVRCWLQDANGWFAAERAPGEPILVPELLLHDETLVKVDAAAGENLVRGVDGQYRRIKAASGGATTPAIKGFVAADDAETLQPVAFAANETRQFYLKLAVPAGAAPGLYRGRISFSAGGRELGHFRLALRVTKHQLGAPTSRFSGRSALDGRGIASGTYPAVTSTDYEPYHAVVFLPRERIAKSVFSFLAADGVDSPAVPRAALGQVKSLFGAEPRTLWVAEPNALATRPGGVTDRDALLATAREALTTGIRDIRLFVPSRADGDGLAADRAALDAVDALGVRTWAQSNFATYTNAADVLTSPFEYGLPQDKVGTRLPPMAGDPYGGMEQTDSRLIENWHAIGTPLYLAVTLPAGIENPSLWRRAVGLQCFYVGYEGFILPRLFEADDPWNDWTRQRLRSRTFLYPTKSGFVSTLAWEGVAEGLVDVRYLSAVRRLAAAIRYPEPADYKVDMEGRKATMWLQWINPRSSALDTVRLECIAWIEKLDAVLKATGRQK